ncbi:hypothetical protein FS749_002670 [Ceratobasidium sp. UAMH 11750]|nr:hypothetical protein FS749_002670 [Ceratobasidium sp. UAMH 11750]
MDVLEPKESNIDMSRTPPDPGQSDDPISSLIDRQFLAALKSSPAERWTTENLPPLSALSSDSTDPSASSSTHNDGTVPDAQGDVEDTPDTYDFSMINDGTRRGADFLYGLRGLCRGNPVRHGEWMKAAEEMMKDPFSTASPSVIKRRESLQTRYNTFIAFRDPKLKFENFWLVATILKYWETFFVALVETARGRAGDDNQTLRASTVQQWGVTFIWLIGRKAFDGEGNLVGRSVLNQGLWTKIKDRIAWFSQKFSLARHAMKQKFIGRVELLLMMRAGFENTKHYGRAPFQQLVVAMCLLFQIGARIGSLGWSSTAYRDSTQYMKLEDLTIRREGFCKWTVIVKLLHIKGRKMRADAGHVVAFQLDPVTKIHNLWFDMGLHTLTYLLMRGALQGCETLQDIFDYSKDTFIIKPKMRKEPLFLERTAGGREFGTGPASAEGLTKSMTVLGTSVGIAGVSAHGIRRETGNRIGLILGVQAAQALLTHAEGENTFTTHYSHNTLSLPVTQVALGMLDHTAPEAGQIALRRHTQQQSVRESEDEDEEDPQAPSANLPGPSTVGKKRPTVRLTREEEAKARSDPNVKRQEAILAELWDTFYGHMPDETKVTHQPAAEGINSAFRHYASHPKFIENRVLLEQVQKDIVKGGTNLSNALRKARRPFHDAKRQKRAKEANAADTTTEERDHAITAANTLANSPANLPDLNLNSSFLASVGLRKPGFGRGLLTAECRQEFSNPRLIEQLQADTDREVRAAEEQEMQEEEEGDEEADIRFDKTGEDEDGIVIQDVPKFKDDDEIQVIDAKLPETKMAFMAALFEPVIHDKIDRERVKAHGDQWPCLHCKHLPEDMKPRGGQWLFNDKVHLLRHQAQHSNWDLLRDYMRTDDATKFKCPYQECKYRSADIADVQSHCLASCSESTLFRSLKDEHDNRTGPGSDPNKVRLQAKKLVTKLARGYKLQGYELGRIDWWTDFDDEKVDELAELCQHDPDEIRAFLPEIRELMRLAKGQITEEGVLSAPEAPLSVDEIVQDYLTVSTQQRIDSLLQRVAAGERPRPRPQVQADGDIIDVEMSFE